MTFTPPTPLPSAPRHGPCQWWTTVADVRANRGLDAATADDAAVTFGIELASLVLWTATGRRYGLCLRTLRPCWDGDSGHGYRVSTHAPPPSAYGPELAVNHSWWGGVRWYGMWPDGWKSSRGCSCHVPLLRLPAPIAAVESIVIDGVALDRSLVRIVTTGPQARAALARIDEDTWPCCQNLYGDPAQVPATDTGCPAWQVTYWQGRPIPDSGARAAEQLAEQFAKAWVGAPCSPTLTQGLTQVARRGVTRSYDPKVLRTGVEGVTTGIDTVDRWIASVNPTGRPRPAAIVRADDPERRRLWSWVDADDTAVVTAPTSFGLEATEDLTAGAPVNIHTGSGDGAVRLADAATGLPAHGFAAADYTTGDQALIYTAGVVDQFTGLTPGLPVWLGAAGTVTQTQPVTEGWTIQSLGVAVAPTKAAIDLAAPNDGIWVYNSGNAAYEFVQGNRHYASFTGDPAPAVLNTGDIHFEQA